MTDQIEWARQILFREAASGLYGSVTFTFQNGAICAAKVEKSEKPPAPSVDKKAVPGVKSI